mmetsp:Transcript_7775/g.28452  ORF Transcript_7775/g.28452 Transcript_7775/m.28452 type:complete len:395 (+) Transcript_7775:77-1261(+)
MVRRQGPPWCFAAFVSAHLLLWAGVAAQSDSTAETATTASASTAGGIAGNAAAAGASDTAGTASFTAARATPPPPPTPPPTPPPPAPPRAPAPPIDTVHGRTEKAKLLQATQSDVGGERALHVLEELSGLARSPHLTPEDKDHAARNLNDRAGALVKSLSTLDSPSTLYDLAKLLSWADAHMNEVLAPSQTALVSGLTVFCQRLLQSIRVESRPGHIEHPLQEYLHLAAETHAPDRCPPLMGGAEGTSQTAYQSTIDNAQRSIDGFYRVSAAMGALKAAAKGRGNDRHRDMLAQARRAGVPAEDLKPFEQALTDREAAVADLKARLAEVVQPVHASDRPLTQHQLEMLQQMVDEADRKRLYDDDHVAMDEGRLAMREGQRRLNEEYERSQRGDL